MNPDKVDEILTFHSAQKEKIEARLDDFRRIWDVGSDRDLFAELAFCILTPQSRARTCWPAVERLRKGDLLFVGTAEEILEKLSNVRFKDRKASYIAAQLANRIKVRGLNIVASASGDFIYLEKA